VQRTGLLFHLGNGGIPLILIDHVEFDEVCLATSAVDLCDQCVATLAAASSNEYSGALSGEQPGGRTPHAAVASGDQRGLVLKPHNGLQSPPAPSFTSRRIQPARFLPASIWR
jgi:hypothetical protein